MSIRVGLLGLGIMGAHHARTLAREVKHVEIHSLYDSDETRAHSVATEVGAKSITKDHLELIASPEIDAVLIASPDNTHSEFVKACFDHGKPVFCEKPLASTVTECLHLVDLEVKKGRRLLQLGFMRRFDPAYVEMKAHLTSGNFGKPLVFHHSHRNVSAPAWFDSRMAISNSSIHEFDIARWLLEEEFVKINVFRPRASFEASVGAPLVMVLQTRGGRLVNIEVYNNASYGYEVQGEVLCENGTISLHAPLRTTTKLNFSMSMAYPSDWRQRFAEAYRIQAQAWIDSIIRDIPVGASAWDGYVAAAIAEAGLASLDVDEGCVISQPDKPRLYATLSEPTH